MQWDNAIRKTNFAGDDYDSFPSTEKKTFFCFVIFLCIYLQRADKNVLSKINY